MERLLMFGMYALWVVTIIAILAATFTDFKYEDLNFLAVFLLIAAVINSLFTVRKKKE